MSGRLQNRTGWERVVRFAALPLCCFLLLPFAALFAENAAENTGSVIYEDRILCGPISLALAAEMAGVKADVQHIANWVSLSKKGTSLADLAAAASKLGLRAEGFELRSPDQLVRLGKTSRAIALLFQEESEEGHFCVVWPADKTGLWVAEYPKPVRRVLPMDLRGKMDLRVLVIRRPGDPGPFAGLALGYWLFPAAFLSSVLLSFLFFRLRRQ